MFPYTPDTSPTEVIAFMRGLGATTLTRVPRNGHTVLPGYETRPWAQPPASIAFYAPACVAGGPVAKWMRSSTLAQPVRTNENWLSVINQLFGRDLGLDWRIRDNGAYQQDIGDKEFILLDKIGDRLAQAGYRRKVTAPTVMLFMQNYRGRVFSPHHPNAQLASAALPDPWQALYAVAAVVNCGSLTSAQQVDCLTREIDIAALEGLLTRGIPYPLIRDLYPVRQESRYFKVI